MNTQDNDITIRTSLSHRGYSLVKVSYMLFAVFFIYCFSTADWFSIDLSLFGFPIIILIIGISHFILLAFETNPATKFFKFLFKGRPVGFYRTWVKLHGVACNESENIETETGDDSATTNGGTYRIQSENAAFSYGLKKIRLSVVSELELSIWGNLIIKSNYAQGKADHSFEPDVVAKLPLGAVNQADQSQFINVIKEASPAVHLNKRLEKRLDSKIVKGEELVKSLGALFLSFVLLDLGYATGYFLEIEKHYYLSQAIVRRSDFKKDVTDESERLKLAKSELDKADKMMDNRLGISIVQRALFDHGSAVGGIMQARAEALWSLGKPKEAIESLEKAHQLYPKSLKLMIELARWKYIQGDLEGCKAILEKAIKEHDEDLLPCLYVIAADKNLNLDSAEIEKKCNQYVLDLDEIVFGEEPSWPPGGNRFLSERIYRDDVVFLAKLLLGVEIQ